MKEKLENITKIEMLEEEIRQGEEKISKFFPKANPSEELLRSIKGNIQAELRQQSSRKLYRRLTAIAACVAIVLALSIKTYTNEAPAPLAPMAVATVERATGNINWDTEDDAFNTLSIRLKAIEDELYSSEDFFEDNNTNFETQISELYATLFEG